MNQKSLQVTFELLFSELKHPASYGISYHRTHRQLTIFFYDLFFCIEVCVPLSSTPAQLFHSSPSPFMRPRPRGGYLRVMLHVPYRNVQSSLSLASVQFAVPDLPQHPITDAGNAMGPSVMLNRYLQTGLIYDPLSHWITNLPLKDMIRICICCPLYIEL
jgi:hypothetical protein